MTADSLRVKYTRRSIEVVEMDLDVCLNSYGVSPCAAAGAAGSECYNTRKTCQDSAHYNRGTKTYRFVKPNQTLPAGVLAYPFLTSVQTSPTVLELNKISRRAQITVEFKDSSHHDRGIDPYHATRAFDADSQGTFFNKLFARNPYLSNRVLRVKTGYINPAGFDTSFSTDFETRTYLIDRVEGPDAQGTVRVVAKDVLKLTDDKKSKIPVANEGSTGAAMTAIQTTIVLNAGEGAAYPSSGTVRVDDEFISYSGKSADTLTGCTRALYGSSAATHNSDARVQVCVAYNGANVSDVLYDVLVNYANIPSTYVPKSDWDNEVSTWLSSHTLTNVLSEPTGVQEVVETILEQTTSALWWDERAQEIKFKTTAPVIPGTSIFEVNDDNILRNTFTLSVLDKERVSRASIYYNMVSYTEDRDSAKNFSTVHVRTDSAAESADEYGESVERVVYGDWITASGPALEMAGRVLRLFRDSPFQISFHLDAKDGGELWTGDVFSLNSKFFVDVDGAPRPTRFLVTKARETKAGVSFEYTAISFDLLARLGLVAPDTMPDYLLASIEDRSKYAFISDNSGLLSNGDEGNTIA